MNAARERIFFEVTDKSFKITLLLRQIKFLNDIIVFIIGIFLSIIRVVVSRNQNNTKKLVIICLHRLGDTVFCIPTINGIIDCYKDYEITIVAYPETIGILKLKFDDFDIKTINKENFILQRRFAKSRNKIRDLKPEIIFDLTGNPASASLIFNSKARKLIGTNLVYFKKLYNTFVPIRENPHFMDIYFDILKKEKPEYNDYSYEFNPELNFEGRILIHPFAIRKAKEWNLNKYIELANRLGKIYEVSIIAPPKFINDEIIDEINLSGIRPVFTKTVNKLIEELKQASLFISNDSGPIYIASLLGKPTFTIYGPTNPQYSLPFGKYHSHFQKRLDCSAVDEKFCFTLGGVNCPSYECLNLISVDEVESSVIKFADKIGIKTKTQKGY